MIEPVVLANEALLLRVGVLYLPAVAVIGLAIWHPGSSSRRVGALFAFGWLIPSIAIANMVATEASLWSYGVSGPTLAGMPLDLLIGWALLWGALPALLIDCPLRVPVVVLLVIADLTVMPLLEPVVILNDGWLVGEALAVGIALLPALAVAGWTTQQRHLGPRTVLVAGAFGGLTLLVAVPGLLSLDLASTELANTAALIPATLLMGFGGLLAISGVHELAAEGEGTPVPLDPPIKLVTSGPYRYVRNPLQLGMTMLLMGITMATGNAIMLLATLAATIFAAGFAHWHEGTELDHRFGEPWRRYKVSVSLWLPSWRPSTNTPATFYVDTECSPCADVKHWAERSSAAGLAVRPANLAGHVIYRATYRSNYGNETTGIAALCRVMEHRNLAWAMLGFLGRLPGIARLLQELADLVGAGPHPVQPLHNKTTEHLRDSTTSPQ